MGADENDPDRQTPMLTDVAGRDDDPVIPVLRDAVVPNDADLREAQLAAIQSELTALAHELTERLLHAALREMEAALFQQVSDRLRAELPNIVEKVLRDHLETGP